jgi:rifampicin phosphotransferase
MTALSPPPIKLNRVQRRLGYILIDYVPVLPYPIDMSGWVPHGPAGMTHGVRDGFMPNSRWFGRN